MTGKTLQIGGQVGPKHKDDGSGKVQVSMPIILKQDVSKGIKFKWIFSFDLLTTDIFKLVNSSKISN